MMIDHNCSRTRCQGCIARAVAPCLEGAVENENLRHVPMPDLYPTLRATVLTDTAEWNF
jgi:hypothetical protein